MSTPTAPQHRSSYRQDDEARVLPSGEREFFMDVSTSDLALADGRPRYKL